MLLPPTAHARRVAPSRESVTTIADDGSHVFLHPADARGRFTRWRRISAVALIACYVLLPWISIRGNPALFFDLENLRFHCFGLTLAAQDMWLAFFLISGLGFLLFYVTALFGRLWCGWACPQTVFLEHVYRRIERWLEGDAPSRRRLDAAPWTGAKWARRGVKHALFVLVSLVIAHVLLAYFVSLPRVFELITHSPLEQWGVFAFILGSTGILYFNFAWFREQLCIILCPYGRLQSALIDDNTVSIGYDARRGEPRGRRRTAEVGRVSDPPRADMDRVEGEAGQRPALLQSTPVQTSDFGLLTSTTGDCIDCFRCVQVCPTGIDIRQGLQLECIGCASCIDACDEIMTRIGRPRGLVRYDSLNGLGGGRTRLLRPRLLLYTALLLVGALVATFAVSRYQAANLSVLRMTGAPYFVDADALRNQFLVRVINKRTEPVAFTLRVLPGGAAPAALKSNGWEDAVTVAPQAEEVRPLVLLVPREAYEGNFRCRVEVRATDDRSMLAREFEFVGPDPRLFKAHAASHP